MDKLIIIAFLGALTNEVLHWYNLKKELKGDVKVTNSKSYWIITIISMITFTIATQWVYQFILPNTSLSEEARVFLTALSFPFIIKDIFKVIIKSFTSFLPSQGEREGHPRGRPENDIKKKGSFTILEYLK
ncbi:hypothetical protein [Pseudotenacibaculum haliotis]|uniref:Uncharacterized protein n=1 Tax=Pseudotenacibaculum haliotis TaxID=1862138 RepID=A0ABW5LT29_9FLAO